MADDVILPAGAAAPDFELPAADGRAVRLSAFRGRPVVLVFYPADWSPTCGDQLAVYAELAEQFDRYRAVMLGISVDGGWCHAAYAADHHIPFPLLSDFEPKGIVARTYGAYRPDMGMAGRALFVLDGDGVVRWSYLAGTDENPGADGILAALDQLEPAGAR